MTEFFDPERTLISDTECFGNLWSIGFLRPSDGKTLVMELSDRKRLDLDRLRRLLYGNLIVGYNWQGYDAPMVCKALSGATTEELKRTNDQIIMGGIKYWQVEDQLGIRVPREMQFWDLMEPQPNAWASLKTLAGRLHAPKMQDLPYPPDTHLTHDQMDEVLSYMVNDLENTRILFDALREPLELRAALWAEYGA